MNDSIEELVQLREYLTSCININKTKLTNYDAENKYINELKTILETCKDNYNLLLNVNEYTIKKTIKNATNNEKLRQVYQIYFKKCQNLNIIYMLINKYYDSIKTKMKKNYYFEELKEENLYYQTLLNSFDVNGFTKYIEDINSFKELIENSQLLPKNISKIISLVTSSNKKLKPNK